LFAGSGANGIEALSRGASYCVFVDNDSGAISEIASNLRRAKLEQRARILRLHLPDGLKKLTQQEDKFDVLYADPPFGFGLYDNLLEQIELLKTRREGGIVLIEHDMSADLPERVGNLVRTRQSKYGRIGISIFS
jgi:16S rRNA (guanine(966)-N(2))-methyltransferase RsmD